MKLKFVISQAFLSLGALKDAALSFLAELKLLDNHKCKLAIEEKIRRAYGKLQLEAEAAVNNYQLYMEQFNLPRLSDSDFKDLKTIILSESEPRFGVLQSQYIRYALTDIYDHFDLMGFDIGNIQSSRKHGMIFLQQAKSLFNDNRFVQQCSQISFAHGLGLVVDPQDFLVLSNQKPQIGVQVFGTQNPAAVYLGLPESQDTIGKIQGVDRLALDSPNNDQNDPANPQSSVYLPMLNYEDRKNPRIGNEGDQGIEGGRDLAIGQESQDAGL